MNIVNEVYSSDSYAFNKECSPVLVYIRSASEF